MSVDALTRQKLKDGKKYSRQPFHVLFKDDDHDSYLFHLEMILIMEAIRSVIYWELITQTGPLKKLDLCIQADYCHAC